MGVVSIDTLGARGLLYHFDIIRCRTTAVACVKGFHSTLVMNILTSRFILIPAQRYTKLNMGLLSTTHPDEATKKAVKKYTDRGYIMCQSSGLIRSAQAKDRVDILPLPGVELSAREFLVDDPLILAFDEKWQREAGFDR